jgi:hypothetical protein
MKFYEVRRQLQNKNRWIKEAFFQNREDAEKFITFRTKYLQEDRFPDGISLDFTIVEHQFHAPLATGNNNRTTSP